LALCQGAHPRCFKVGTTEAGLVAELQTLRAVVAAATIKPTVDPEQLAALLAAAVPQTCKGVGDGEGDGEGGGAEVDTGEDTLSAMGALGLLIGLVLPAVFIVVYEYRIGA
jgi:hypothetical protein